MTNDQCPDHPMTRSPDHRCFVLLSKSRLTTTWPQPATRTRRDWQRPQYTHSLYYNTYFSKLNLEFSFYQGGFPHKFRRARGLKYISEFSRFFSKGPPRKRLAKVNVTAQRYNLLLCHKWN